MKTEIKTLNYRCKVHFFDGEKGGTGKSFLTQVVVDYCLSKKIPFTLVDTDRTNPDVYNTYSEVIQQQNRRALTAFFSESEDKLDSADQIFNAALDCRQILVNLPSQIADFTSDWLRRNDFKKLIANGAVLAGELDLLSDLSQGLARDEMWAGLSEFGLNSFVDCDNSSTQNKLEEGVNFEAFAPGELSPTLEDETEGLLYNPNCGISFYKWFVTTGTADSLRLFVESLEEWGKWIPHILAVNLGYAKDPGKIHQLKEWLLAYRVPVLLFPKLALSKKEWEEFVAAPKPFSVACKSGSLVTRQRFYNFLKVSYLQLKRIQLFEAGAISPLIFTSGYEAGQFEALSSPGVEELELASPLSSQSIEVLEKPEEDVSSLEEVDSF